MTIYYRDELGIVAEEMSDGESGNSIDFCDGFAYFTAGDGETERKIHLSALVRIER